MSEAQLWSLLLDEAKQVDPKIRQKAAALGREGWTEQITNAITLESAAPAPAEALKEQPAASLAVVEAAEAAQELLETVALENPAALSGVTGERMKEMAFAAVAASGTRSQG